ncbi:MAG: hypothetical protein EXQ55_05865 [Acidobacteria bacterium]|nr:hypothetical protein [Acidobacteriota bacterium]
MILGLVALAVTLVSAQAPAPGRELGSLVNGRYHHNRTGIEFVVPQEWSISATGPNSDGSEGVQFKDSVTGAVLSVWMIRQADFSRGVGSDTDSDPYRHTVGLKIQQRRDQGMPDYWVRTDRIEETMIGGRAALKAVGDFTQTGDDSASAGKALMSECLTWIDAKDARAFFYARVPAADWPNFQWRFDQIVGTAVVP